MIMNAISQIISYIPNIEGIRCQLVIAREGDGPFYHF